jgi:hypothetical protein
MPIGFVGPALQGASLISRFGVPLLQQAGIGAGVAGLGALANAASKTPSNAPGTNRRANVGSNRYSGIIGSIPPSANGESYRRAELRLGDAARTGGGGGGGGNAGYSVPSFTGQAGGSTFASAGSPADRAYQQEASRVAQLTAQDPELQRYEKARSAAKTQEEMNAARDIGMQIWQQKYGGTPMGQPGGAVGSFNPLMQKTFGYQAGMSPNQIAQTITNPAAIPVAPGEAPYQTGDLGTRATADTGYDPAAYGITPEMIEKLKAQSLAQARK